MHALKKQLRKLFQTKTLLFTQHQKHFENEAKHFLRGLFPSPFVQEKQKYLTV